jgi:hypothetical protein
MLDIPERHVGIMEVTISRDIQLLKEKEVQKRFIAKIPESKMRASVVDGRYPSSLLYSSSEVSKPMLLHCESMARQLVVLYMQLSDRKIGTSLKSHN